MTQSSFQNKRVTHSSMFAEVHFTNASSLPQIPMQCMHCKMLANICMYVSIKVDIFVEFSNKS